MMPGYSIITLTPSMGCSQEMAKVRETMGNATVALVMDTGIASAWDSPWMISLRNKGFGVS